MSFTPQSKTTSTFTPASKNTSTFDGGAYFLLQENLAYLLQENGGRILLQESYNYKKPMSWLGETKNTSSLTPASKNTSSFVAATKH
jgi:hypothetical protein